MVLNLGVIDETLEMTEYTDEHQGWQNQFGLVC